MQFAHEHGVLHRDLKPGNILLREDGEPLVADFGLAKLSADGTHSLSVTGHVVGTLENMAPEQAESSKDVDERADVYSLGTILYQMLTGRRHFEATGNIIGDAQALQTHEPPKLRSINPNIDPDLEIITLKALRNDPAERYRNVAALRADIERFRKGEVISAKPVQAVDLIKKLIQRNRAVAAVTAASILIFITGALVAIVILSHQLKRAQDASDFARQQQSFAEEQRALAEMRRRTAEEQETKARAARLTPRSRKRSPGMPSTRPGAPRNSARKPPHFPKPNASAARRPRRTPRPTSSSCARRASAWRTCASPRKTPRNPAPPRRPPPVPTPLSSRTR